MRSLQFVIPCCCVLAAAVQVRADALVVTQAMKASTIAEIFVEEDEVRIEIEVGGGDLVAFANILPDEAYTRLTGESRPLSERIETFLQSDWVITADDRRLDGELVRVTPGKRLVRDEVTGEPLLEQPADAEPVIRVIMRYALDSQPGTLTIKPPQTDGEADANIGFVCYHNGLPVNDFRYLAEEVKLDLDWEDSWFSKFRHPNFRRQYDAPLSAYLYIKPYEVRQEIIVRPKDLDTWLDLRLSAGDVISAEDQEELKRRVADFLKEKNPVTIDGNPTEGRLDRIHFIRRTLRTTGIIEPAVDLDVNSATLGVIFVYPVTSLPEQVSLQWELFTRKIQAVPAVASDEAGGLPTVLTPADPLLVWKNYLTNPTSPQMLTVEQPPLQRHFTIPLLSAIFLGVAVVSLVVVANQQTSGNDRSRPAMATAIAALVAGALCMPFAKIAVANPFDKPPQLSVEQSKDILAGLLYNVYRSFDHHDESLIYDRLAQSISGELLSEVYVETRKSMEIKNQGGLRISVKDVSVEEVEAVETTGSESTFQCRWRVSGWIGHWGHIHARENEHVALITIAPRDGRWKITALETLDARPHEPSQVPPSGRRSAGA